MMYNILICKQERDFLKYFFNTEDTMFPFRQFECYVLKILSNTFLV